MLVTSWWWKRSPAICLTGHSNNRRAGGKRRRRYGEVALGGWGEKKWREGKKIERDIGLSFFFFF